MSDAVQRSRFERVQEILDRAAGVSAADYGGPELGSAFLCSHLGVPVCFRDDHAAYIKGWISLLKDDKRAIFKASALAAKAADYLREKAEP